MKKNQHNSQSLLNNVLIASIVGLAIYSAALTYVVFTNQKASQNINDSFAEQIFKLQLKVDNPQNTTN